MECLESSIRRRNAGLPNSAPAALAFGLLLHGFLRIRKKQILHSFLFTTTQLFFEMSVRICRDFYVFKAPLPRCSVVAVTNMNPDSRTGPIHPCMEDRDHHLGETDV
jgi:hypothetical protein